MFGCEPCDHYFIDCSAYYNHAKRRHGKISTAHFLTKEEEEEKSNVVIVFELF